MNSVVRRCRVERTSGTSPVGGGADQEIAALLVKLREGDRAVLERLIPLVYDELQRIAAQQLRWQRLGHTLDTTALVHETYLKLLNHSRIEWRDRAHFFALAARAMRQILIDNARSDRTAKRGGRWRRIPLDDILPDAIDQMDISAALEESLQRLRTLNERMSRVVEYRFFRGMSEEEVAASLGITARTVRRDWTKARLWLYAELAEEGADGVYAKVVG